MANGTLSKKHKAFSDAYLQKFHGTEAYLAAYPKSSYDAARSNAARLLARDDVRSYIADRMAAAQLSADEALQRLAEIARGDIGQVLGADGRIDIELAQKRGLTRLFRKVKNKTTRIGRGSDEREIEEVEVELYDAQAAIRDVLRVHGKFADRVDVTSGGEPVRIVVKVEPE